MQTFSTPGLITTVLDIPAGRIHVIAAERADTTVETRPADPSKARDVKLAEQVTAGYSDGILRITAPAGNRIFGSSGAVEVTVQLPAGSRVEAKAASAQFSTAGRLGDVAFDSSQGRIGVEEAAAARLTTVDGDIAVRLVSLTARPLPAATRRPGAGRAAECSWPTGPWLASGRRSGRGPRATPASGSWPRRSRRAAARP
jgi:hypothetical protein